jgi:hypothetical protein
MANSINIYRGASFSHAFTLTDISGTPIDLTGATLTSEIRKTERGQIIATTIVEEIDYSIGEGRLTMTDDVTREITEETGVLDILIVYPDTTVQRSALVNVVIHQGVTEKTS